MAVEDFSNNDKEYDNSFPELCSGILTTTRLIESLSFVIPADRQWPVNDTNTPHLVVITPALPAQTGLFLADKSFIMRKLIMKMSISVDGFVGGPNGENDWVFRSSDETSRAWAVERSWEAGLIIMGRKSFEMMAPYWPTATGPFAAPMNEIPKALFTQKGFKGIDPEPGSDQSTAAASWAEARVFNGDLAEEIRQLKSEPGKPVYAIGGAGFMRSLIATGLIDEYQLITHPVVLGKGQTIFNGVTQPLDLKLADVKFFPGGIVAHTYYPDRH